MLSPRYNSSRSAKDDQTKIATNLKRFILEARIQIGLVCRLELYKAIRLRRSVRRYRPDPVPDQIIRKIMEAASWAPSSSNSQPWEFVVVRDRNTLEKLSRTHAYAGMLKGAPMCIVACSDPTRSPNHWVEDCSIAVENMLLAARAEGLGTCWIAVYRPTDQQRENRVREVLSIPKDIRVVALVGVGYPAENPQPPARRKLEEIIHYEKY